MPRASTETTDEAPKRAPRKRAVRRTVPKADAPIRRTRTPRVAAPRIKDEVVAPSDPIRKAPTPFAKNAEAKGVMRKKLLIVGGLLVLVSSVAAFIGFSDSGQIDVSSRINEANSRTPVATQEVDGATSGEGQIDGSIPVQNNTPPAAISGLRGRGVGTPLVTQETQVPEVASTTDVTATTTEESTEAADSSETEQGSQESASESTTTE